MTTDNVFAGNVMDRASSRRRDEAWLVGKLGDPDTKIIPVWRAQSLVRPDGQAFRAVPLAGAEAKALLAAGEPPVFLGLLAGTAYFAVDISARDPSDLSFLSDAGALMELRQIGALLPQGEGALLGYARAMTHWHRMHRFCGRCGAANDSAHGGHVRRCSNPDCRTEHYPRTDPAVIMLVTCGDQCLLGRQAAWPAGMVSTLAGFVEPGETPEEAVIREVLEETGVVVTKALYHSSQPWPFPGSLMIGFTAETDHCAHPVIDRHELESAVWFSRADLASLGERGLSLPGRYSIARRLIEDWLAGG